MKVAIYSRKSRFTGQGESIESQVDMCKNYALSHLDVSQEDLIIYEDEGFSGVNIDRPQFQNMLKDAQNKLFGILICYRLDRVSRNVADFSSFVEQLQKRGIGFISIKEQFDTTTPMGRAMLYVSSVFAQLERETIAERIRDNMLFLAKSGRWLGGVAPLGYASEQISYCAEDGKPRKLFKLNIIPDEAAIVSLIYAKYIELGSLVKLEQYLIRENIRTKRNEFFRIYTLRFILANPAYCAADQAVYNYLLSMGGEIYADKLDFSLDRALMVYNKTNQKSNANRKNDISEWIISIGAHTPIISSDVWILTQKMLRGNIDKRFRKTRSQEAVLSGIIRCANCGSYMRPKHGRTLKDGSKAFYYMCEMKERSNRTLCDMRNANGQEIDALVVDQIMQIALGCSLPSKDITKKNIVENVAAMLVKRTDNQRQIQALKREISSLTVELNRLSASLATSHGMAAASYIIDQINERDSIKSGKMRQFSALQSESEKEDRILEADGSRIAEKLLEKFESLGKMNSEQQRNLISTVVNTIVWHGDNLEIELLGFVKNSEAPSF